MPRRPPPEVSFRIRFVNYGLPRNADLEVYADGSVGVDVDNEYFFDIPKETAEELANAIFATRDCFADAPEPALRPPKRCGP